jgi:hypothetical protein
MSKRTSKDKSSHFNNMREWIQLIVIVFAAAWGSYEFIVKDIIRPAQKPTALDLTANLEIVGKKNEKILVRARITARNPTDRRIYVPAYWFTVRGYRFLDSAKPMNTNHKSILEKLRGSELVRTYAPVESGEVVAQQRIIYEADAWWEPEDKTNDEAIFVVPKEKFDFLELHIQYLHTRDDSVLDVPVWFAAEDGAWQAQFQLKKGGSEASELIKWQKSTGSGYSWYITTLSLWDPK